MKRHLILLLSASLGLAAAAQTAGEPGYEKKVINECQRLYSDGEYSAALTLIEKVNEENLCQEGRREFDLLKALATFENDHREGRALMLQYLDKYRNTSKSMLLNCHIAESYYLDRRYDYAEEWFDKSDIKRLDGNQKERATLYRALTILETGHEEEAIGTLQELKAKDGSYATDATFYLAVTDYDNGELDDARAGFKSIQNQKKYFLDIPYYLAAIELKKGNTGNARTIATRFIGDHKEKPQGIKMKQILGSAEFLDGNYENAISNLEEYLENSSAPQRIAYYQMGLSLFEMGDFDGAKKYLANSLQKESNDELAQNALLHKGIAELALDEPESALLDFERAVNMPFDGKVREDAMYNYAMCLHKGQHSAFGKNVKAFETFLNEYPESEHAETVGEHLAAVYMNTRDYATALNSIEKIKEPSADILRAKQKVLYRMGVQEFINNDMQQAVKYMDRSLELKKYSKETEADAHYWKGEALYNLGDYTKAENAFRSSFAIGGEKHNRAIYGTGYTLFQKGKYDDARKEFLKFASRANREDKDILADTYNRIGDTYFYQRNYNKADSLYRKAASTSSSEADYPLFRAAIAQGLTNDNSKKVATLKRLVENNKNSSYIEEAYYEMGRAYIELRKDKEAIKAFEKLIQLKPSGAWALRARAEKAMIYNNMNDKEKAIKAYKEIIELYPHSEEAKIAAQDLKNIYVEMGRVQEYAKYAEKTAGMQKVESSEIDTLTYMAAERTYSKNRLKEAESKFEEYLSGFPNGAFRVNSHYYLGVIGSANNKNKSAVMHFEEVIAVPGNKFREEALNSVGKIYVSGKQHGKVIETYKELANISGSKERIHLANLNIMRSSFATGKYSDAIAYAGKILANKSAEQAEKREARFTRAKSYLEMNEEAKAVNDLKELAKDTRTKEGAESKYLYAEILFDQDKYTECEKEIFNYIEESTPHIYWLARSFILLADLYIEQEKPDDAKQYLISLQNSYQENDDIAGMIEERMKECDEMINKSESKGE